MLSCTFRFHRQVSFSLSLPEEIPSTVLSSASLRSLSEVVSDVSLRAFKGPVVFQVLRERGAPLGFQVTLELRVNLVPKALRYNVRRFCSILD